MIEITTALKGGGIEKIVVFQPTYKDPNLKSYSPLLIHGAIKSAMESIGFYGPLNIELVGVKERANLQMIKRVKQIGQLKKATRKLMRESDQKIDERIAI